MNTKFDDVTWLNILLNSDIKDIKNISLTNTTTKRICNDNYFWDEKMKYDGITNISSIEPTYTHWVKLYNINKKVCNLLELCKFEHHSTKSSIHLYFYLIGNTKIDHILSNHKDDIDDTLKEIDQDKIDDQILYIQLYDKDDETIILTWYFEDENGDEIDNDDEVFGFEKNIKHDEVKDILAKMLYYYPNVIIKDNFGLPYQLQSLIKMNVEPNANLPINKILNNRIQFLQNI